MDKLKNELRTKIQSIMGHPIADNDNLYELGIDSFSLAHLLESLDEFSKTQNVTLNIDAIVTEDELSIESILKFCTSKE